MLRLLGAKQIERKTDNEEKTEGDLPSGHGEISVEHPLAHLLPLNSPGKFQVRELIS